MMGGRLWAESEPGQGSAFYFTVCLPLAEHGAGSKEPGVMQTVSPELPTPRSPLYVLLVEDNPASQKLAGHIFREAGHSLDVAHDGQQALRLLERNPYDAVLMDVQMPVMDGLAAASAIRERESHRQPGQSGRVPIIAMTARAMKGDRERCLAAGMDDYISKPFDAAEILAAIARLTAGAGSREQGARSTERGARSTERGVGRSNEATAPSSQLQLHALRTSST